MTFAAVPVLLVATFVAVAPALADTARPSLPGVTQPPPIVKPRPEPADAAPTSADGFVRMGNWDVRVSGSVAVDVNAGTLKTLPR